MKAKALDFVALKDGRKVTILEAFPKEKYKRPHDEYMIEDGGDCEIIKDDDIVEVVYRP
jgi:hypothetical protein